MKKKKVRKGAAKSRSRKTTAKKATRKKPATRKKKTTAVKRKKTTTKKTTTKKKTAKTTKKKTKAARTPVKKAAARMAAPKPRVSRPGTVAVQKPRPVPSPVPPSPPPIPSNEDLVGIITHYYSDLMVAVLQMNQGTLRVGDRIHVKGHTSDFEQTVGSMEIEHQHVDQVGAGQIAGLKVIEHAREHDHVYKIRS